MINQVTQLNSKPAAPPLIKKYSLQDLGRITDLARLSAVLLHEISNPLTTACISLEQCADKSPAVTQARRSMQLIRKYVEAARQQVRLDSQLSNFDLKTQINQLKRILLPLAKKAGVQLVFDTSSNCQLYGDSVKFQQILANLVVNAIEAYPTDYSASVKVVRVSADLQACNLMLSVSDQGEGILPEQMKYLFQPFYTTKLKTAPGLGIGLAIVEKYVTEDFNGSIKVNSSKRRGTVFQIKIPLPVQMGVKNSV